MLLDCVRKTEHSYDPVRVCKERKLSTPRTSRSLIWTICEYACSGKCGQVPSSRFERGTEWMRSRSKLQQQQSKSQQWECSQTVREFQSSQEWLHYISGHFENSTKKKIKKNRYQDAILLHNITSQVKESRKGRRPEETKHQLQDHKLCHEELFCANENIWIKFLLHFAARRQLA